MYKKYAQLFLIHQQNRDYVNPPTSPLWICDYSTMIFYIWIIMSKTYTTFPNITSKNSHWLIIELVILQKKAKVIA